MDEHRLERRLFILKCRRAARKRDPEVVHVELRLTNDHVDLERDVKGATIERSIVDTGGRWHRQSVFRLSPQSPQTSENGSARTSGPMPGNDGAKPFPATPGHPATALATPQMLTMKWSFAASLSFFLSRDACDSRVRVRPSKRYLYPTQCKRIPIPSHPLGGAL